MGFVKTVAEIWQIPGRTFFILNILGELSIPLSLMR